MKKTDPDKTHFGFEEVPTAEKTKKVAGVFNSVANNYDLMNDLMSIGIHRIWKKIATDLLQLRSGHVVLDLAGGTGDLTARISPMVGEEGQIVLADINASMLNIGRDRLLDQGVYHNLSIVQADAEQLPFADNYFDRAIIGFGLRNVTNKEKALKSIYQILKPGGFLLVLEFSKPVIPGLKNIYDLYSFKILPMLGKIVAKDEGSYRYLAESIRMHPDQEALKNLMMESGFEKTSYLNLCGGIVAVHKGYKY